MSAWINEATAPNHNNPNGNGFPLMNDSNATPAAMMDPSSFMGNSAQFNPGQQPFTGNTQPHQQQQQHQLAAAMHNGMQMPNAPSSFQNSLYQTNSVIPSKRPRPREDSLAGSPRPNPGMLPTSRSETPQQFPGYQPGGMAQQNSGQTQPAPYNHLQTNGSANATPSPIMGTNMRPGSVPQRVATASPHPFSPGAQQFGAQASPAPSDHGTPQPNPNPYAQAMPTMPQGFNANFTATPSPARPSPNPNAMAGMMSQQQMAGQMGPQVGNQMGNQMGSHMGNQMGGQLGGQMGGQMGSQMTPQMAHHMAQQMPPQLQQQILQQQQQMPQQMSNQMFPPAMQAARGSMDQQQMAAYQARLQKQLQAQGAMSNMHPNMQNMQMAAQLQAQAMGQGRGLMPKQPMQMPNGQVPPGAAGAMRLQQRTIQQEQFIKTLARFMQSKGLPLETNAVIANRPVNLAHLFQLVQSRGGYKSISSANYWPQVGNALGFHPAQVPQAPQLVRELYERNLLRFEEFMASQQSQQRMMQQQQHQAGLQNQINNAGAQPQVTPTKPAMAPGQMAQAQMPQPGQQPPNALPGHSPTPVQQQSYGGQQQPVNGMSPQPHPQSREPTATPSQGRNSISRAARPMSTQPSGMSAPSPAQAKRANIPVPQAAPVPVPPSEPEPPVNRPMTPPLIRLSKESDVYPPSIRPPRDVGGAELKEYDKLGMQIDMLRPDIPHLSELEVIDLQALTRSIESGLHAEVRMALDTLSVVTRSPHRHMQIHLKSCEELVEALVDCAEAQLELLAEDTVEVSDDIQLTSYEEVARSCWTEKMNIRHIPEFGSAEYHLDRAVDRLSCIFMILRNLSFDVDEDMPQRPGGPQMRRLENDEALADEAVMNLLCVLIRYLGTRNMLLRTQASTLEVMKDAIIFVSNIAGAAAISNREHALCLLHFLLAFAPGPGPTTAKDGRLFFPSYEPSVHPYLPYAVDAMAKLLARDEPNRTHFRAIFTSDAGGATPYDLLTKAFAMGISVLPMESLPEISTPFQSVVMERKAILMQGLMAVNILVSLAPGPEAGVVRGWLGSSNGFSSGLLHLVRLLTFTRDANGGRDMDFSYIIRLGVSTLQKLTEKAHDPQDKSVSCVASVPSISTLVQLMRVLSMHWAGEGVVKNLVSYLSLNYET